MGRKSAADPDPKVRRLAVCSLAASGDVRAVEHIVGVLRDEDPEIRQRGAMALGKLGDERAAPALIEAARGEDASLHRAAIALGETREVSAVGPLTTALEDTDPTVRVRAREALEKIRESRVF